MRSIAFLPFLLIGSPLLGQGVPIAPAPSRVFAPAGDTVTRPSEYPAARRSGKRGLVWGATIGAAGVAIAGSLGNPEPICNVTGPATECTKVDGLQIQDVLLGALVGGAVGYLVERGTPRARARSAIPPAPAPSPLFAPAAVPADTTPKYKGPSKIEGGLVGGLGGLLFGIGLATVIESKSPCGCEDPGLDRAVTYGLLGLVAGTVLGVALTGSDGGSQ
jgi:hypothetical protein